MDWDTICKSKEEGVQGIRRLRQMNQALPGKWLWRIKECTNDGLWRLVLEKKYGLPRNGWDLQDPPNKSSAIWRGILSVKKLLMENIKIKLGRGREFFFGKTGSQEMGLWLLSFHTWSNPTCQELVIR